MKVRVVRGVTAIAQGDQIGRVIDAAGGAGHQMVNVGFAVRAWFAASSASMRIASENDSAHGAPVLKLSLGRRKRHSVQLGKPRLLGRLTGGAKRGESMATTCGLDIVPHGEFPRYPCQPGGTPIGGPPPPGGRTRICPIPGT